MSVTMPLEPEVPRQASRAPLRTRRLAKRILGSPAFWLFVVAVGLVVPIVNQLRSPGQPPLPVLGTLGGFSLTDEAGKPFGSEQLAGHVWVGGFIFTRCPTICPVITATMGKLQHRARGLEPTFRLVSFSVDPAYDTPDRLATYARAHKASPRMWSFLTGDLGTVKQTVTEGLKIAMGTPEGEQDFASVFHGTHFVLVDQRLRIRGYYDSSDPEIVSNVLHDAAMLVNRGD